MPKSSSAVTNNQAVLASEDERARRWAVVNALATTLLIAWNYWAGSTRLFGTTIGELSRRFDTSFTPANYAFGIWGLIYLSLLAQAAFHLKRAFFDAGTPTSRTAALLRLGPRMLIAQALCGMWLWAWLTENILLSLLVMTGLFSTLLSIVVVWNMERSDAPAKIIAFEWWPICFYSGWIAVALLANLGAYLSSLGWGFVTEAWWGMVLAAIVTLESIAAVFLRNMREFSLVGMWALVAVSYRHFGSQLHSVSVVALVAAAVLAIVSGYHAWTNFTIPPSEE